MRGERRNSLLALLLLRSRGRRLHHQVEHRLPQWLTHLIIWAMTAIAWNTLHVELRLWRGKEIEKFPGEPGSRAPKQSATNRSASQLVQFKWFRQGRLVFFRNYLWSLSREELFGSSLVRGDLFVDNPSQIRSANNSRDDTTLRGGNELNASLDKQ